MRGGRAVAAGALAFSLTGCLGPPFYGGSNLGHTYRSNELRNPVNCEPIEDHYGDCYYHPYPAVDFGLAHGKPLRAVESGVVVLIGESSDDNPGPWYPREPGRFLLLELDEPEGDCGVVRYSHLSGLAPSLAEGHQVGRGDIVAYAGATQSPNVHLHFDCFTDAAGFTGSNVWQYRHQADYGTIEWCNRRGRRRTGTKETFRRGDRVAMRPLSACR